MNRITTLLVSAMTFALGSAEAKDRKTPSAVPFHEVRGRVIPLGDQPLRTAKVRLTVDSGKEIGERLLNYEGTFAFGGLSSGHYLLTLERENEPMIGRPIEIKNYPAPKVIFLEITLNRESASVRELVTESQDAGSPKEQPSQVSRKALRAFEQAAKESAGGSTAKAIEHLQKAIQEQPNYFEAHNNLAVQYQKLRQWDLASQSYRRAIELRPNSAKIYLNLAALFVEQGQIQPALETLEAACKAVPDSAQVHLALGQLLFQKRDYLKAQESLEAATRLSPGESLQAFLSLIQIALRHDDPARARQYLEVVKKYFPLDPEVSKLETMIPSAPTP